MSDTKVCQYCGESYKRKEQGPGAWARSMYCSVTCKQRAQRIKWGNRKARTGPVRVCQVCGCEFRLQAYRGRKATQPTCSRKCGQVLARQKERIITEHVTHVRIEGKSVKVPVCACGHAATKRIYFRIITATGDVLSTWLAVCEDCRQYMLENDKGCSDTPLPAVEGKAYGFTCLSAVRT